MPSKTQVGFLMALIKFMENQHLINIIQVQPSILLIIIFSYCFTFSNLDCKYSLRFLS